ncbi:hypothetical protein C5167_016206 [Papaver somniferum]|nr:hypothetical protein C5167_016206 [Papaver somniferum]
MDTSNYLSKNDTTPATMMCTTSNDACVTPAEDLRDDSVNVQSNKATTDNSFERDPIIDFITCSMSDLSPLPSQEKKVELVFDEGVLKDNIEHEKLHNFTQLDDTDEVVENMTLANILMTMKDNPEIANSPSSAPEQKIADAKLTFPEPKNVDAGAINPEKSNADANLTVP